MTRRARQSPVSLFSFQDIVTGMCGIMIFMVLVQVLDLTTVSDVNDYTVGVDEVSETSKSSLKREIVELERELAELRVRSRAVVATRKNAARPEELEKVEEKFTERERIIAALVSQVHDLETQVAAAREADAKSQERIKEMERTRRLLEQQMEEMKNSKGITLIPERGDSKIPVYIICSSRGLDIRRPLEGNAQDVVIPMANIDTLFSRFLEDLDHTTHSAVLLVRPTGIAAMNTAVALLKQNSFTFGRDPIEEWASVSFGKEAR